MVEHNHQSNVRRRIYEIINLGNESDIPSRIYDIFMIAVIVLSIVPLCFIHQSKILLLIDYFSLIVFIIDYILRFATADIELKKGPLSFVCYPFTPMAILDLVVILPSFTALNSAFRVLKIMRLFRALRVFKFFRYSKNVQIILSVFSRKKNALLTVLALAFMYVFISAVIVFQVEPNTFGSFFRAIYWATVSLTTVGYGDIYPVSTIGQIVSMISSFFGIAIVALPSGIIITGYQEALDENDDK